jgi:chitin synthase
MSLWLFMNTIFLTIKAFCPLGQDINDAAAKGKTFVSVILDLQGVYGPIFAGLVGTFGIYILASILYLDPWHMLHSFPWYLLVAISFTNVLNTFAFANLNDVSWGSTY